MELPDNEIRDITKLLEEGWKQKLAAVALSAGAALGGYIGSADAQSFANFPWSVVDSQFRNETTERFLKNVTVEDVNKLAFLIGVIEPYYERNDLNRSAEKDYRLAKSLMRQSAEKLMSEKQQDSLRKIQKQGFDKTMQEVKANGWNIKIPGVLELDDLIERVGKEDQSRNVNLHNNDDIKIVFPSPSNPKKIQFEDGTYVGDLKNGIPNGIGTLTYPEGMKWEGEWKNGKLNGKGMFSSIHTKIDMTMYYSGDFKDNEYHGKGIEKIIIGRIVTYYSGDYKDGMLNGNGTQEIVSDVLAGNKYVGEWQDGNKHGQGIETRSEYETGKKVLKNYSVKYENGEQISKIDIGNKSQLQPTALTNTREPERPLSTDANTLRDVQYTNHKTGDVYLGTTKGNDHTNFHGLGSITYKATGDTLTTTWENRKPKEGAKATYKLKNGKTYTGIIKDGNFFNDQPKIQDKSAQQLTSSMSDEEARKAAADKALKDTFRADALAQSSRQNSSTENYATKIRNCIRAGVSFPIGNNQPNVNALFRVSLNTDGSISDINLVRSSGNSKFDNAVKVGIQSCSKFPKIENNNFPKFIDINYNLY
jgi:TonB family protein